MMIMVEAPRNIRRAIMTTSGLYYDSYIILNFDVCNSSNALNAKKKFCKKKCLTLIYFVNLFAKNR